MGFTFSRVQPLGFGLVLNATPAYSLGTGAGVDSMGPSENQPAHAFDLSANCSVRCSSEHRATLDVSTSSAALALVSSWSDNPTPYVSYIFQEP